VYFLMHCSITFNYAFSLIGSGRILSPGFTCCTLQKRVHGSIAHATAAAEKPQAEMSVYPKAQS
jgi:hypothetical protein